MANLSNAKNENDTENYTKQKLDQLLPCDSDDTAWEILRVLGSPGATAPGAAGCQDAELLKSSLEAVFRARGAKAK